MEILCILVVGFAVWLGGTKPKDGPCLMARCFARWFPGVVSRLQAWAQKKEEKES